MKQISIGAEIFIEPGQTGEEIELWFKRLKENGMTVTRIRMFERYLHQPDGTWDFSLFDAAFKAGEKYGVKIYANLFPATDFTDVGGFKFPKNEANLKEIAHYIKHLVTHFSPFPALYGWVPINEPGSGELPADEFSTIAMEQWKSEQTAEAYNSEGFTVLDFSKERFLLTYNTWFLNWLTEQIRLYHPGSVIHVNNHAIFQHVAEYDFPSWRGFLTTLGGSAHASWHFDYFTRQKYALAMSANSEILRSGAGEIPWFMTELQGGNNTYSAFEPMCPTKEEIAQWLWITIGSESKGSIFWCLNPRRSGFEAGEWAMLDYQNQPSDRMSAASSVIGVIDKYADVFEEAKVPDSGISILYTRESLWIEKTLQTRSVKNVIIHAQEGREPGGCMKSALAYFEALSEMGIHPGFKEIGEFDFDKNSYLGEAIILAHQVSIPSKYRESLIRFVDRGGKLIADGLTGYYDENAYSLMNRGFPFSRLFGAAVKEFKMTAHLFEVQLNDPELSLQAHLWQGSLLLNSGIAAGNKDKEVIAVRNEYGKGEVFWVPSLLGLGARIANNYTMLVKLLRHELKEIIAGLPLLFKAHQPDVLMKILSFTGGYITILVNKSIYPQNISLHTEILEQPELLFANGGGMVSSSDDVLIHPEETLVIKWSKKNGVISSEIPPF